MSSRQEPGGFITGRLRTKWTSTPIDEVFFRDTAHGFLAWAVSVVIAAGLYALIALFTLYAGTQIGSQAIGGAAKSVTTAASTVAGRNSDADPTGYLVDSLLRPEQREAPAGGDSASVRAEVGRILVGGVATGGDISSTDRNYLADVVAARTGLARAEAEKRVADIIRQAKDARTKAEATLRDVADAARRNLAYLALWSFIALLAGAFTASYAATFGGQLRDA
jgi:hypothetical protein